MRPNRKKAGRLETAATQTCTRLRGLKYPCDRIPLRRITIAPTLFGDGGLRVFFGLVAVVRAGFVVALGVYVVVFSPKPAPTLFGDGGLWVFFGFVAVLRAGFVVAFGVIFVEFSTKPAPTLFGDGGLRVFFGLVAVVRAGFVGALGVNVVEL
ncbi:MAG: hypothetical protein RIM23_19960, partial [Coleofasciculus sp. G3-WIS-01]|uniref:hypothetical protein n=1 Tax=Coleofasciculus sp. G3-WIS-01 TaxID=3069528 RepID=UPI0032F183F1